jgi:mRNA interferase HigB
MRVLNRLVIDEFKTKHAPSRAALDNWISVTEKARWKSVADVKETFNSVDYVAPHYVFNIGGNNTRLWSTINFKAELVVVVNIETHAEYTKRNKQNKKR